MEANPKSALGHIACCISMGRLALYSDNKTKVALAADAQDEARRALSLEPNNDLAHHLMGRWHYEMAQLNVIVRTLVSSQNLVFAVFVVAFSPYNGILCIAFLCIAFTSLLSQVGWRLQKIACRLAEWFTLPALDISCELFVFCE